MKPMYRQLPIIVALQLSIGFEAFGGAKATIDGPIILPFAKHKIVVLEYDNPDSSTWGREISQILAQEILGTMQGVRGIGVVNLVQPVEKITITASKAVEIAQKQKSLIVIWGEFYAQGASVYVHSHLRIVPQEGFTESGLGLTMSTGHAYDVLANPPTLQVNFVPIEVSSASLKAIRTYYEQTNTLRERPDPKSRALDTLKLGDTFSLIETSADWTKIATRRGARGWIQLATLGSKDELRDLRAVVKFTEGVIQYIGGNFAASEKTLGSYLGEYGDKQDLMNQALGRIVRANARLRTHLGNTWVPLSQIKGSHLASEKWFEEVASEYTLATQLLPDDASPANYLAVIRIMQILLNRDPHYPQLDRRDKVNEVEDKLIHVIQTEHNLESVQNLKSLYFAASMDSSPDERHKYDQRMELLNQIWTEVNSEAKGKDR